MVPGGGRDGALPPVALLKGALGPVSHLGGEGGDRAASGAGRWGAGGCAPSRAGGLDDLARTKTECRDAGWQLGLSRNHGAVARGARGASAEACEAGIGSGVAVVCAGPSRRPCHPSGRGRGGWSSGALEGTATWAAAAPAVGKGVEPTADRRTAAAGLSG